MTMQNPFGMGLDVMRQLGTSQAQIAQTQGERQRQQMLQQQAAEQAALAEQQAMQQQQKDLWALFGNLRKNLPDAQSRIQAIQDSPFAQIQGIEDLMNEQAMSNTGLDQLIAAAPFEQEMPDDSLRFGTVNPRDYTPESLAKYQQSGNYADLVRYYPLKQVEMGGIKYFSDDQGQLFLPVTRTAQGDTKPATPEEVASGEAVPSPQPVGQLTPEQQIAQEAERAAAIETAKTEARAEAEAETPEAIAAKELEKQRAIEQIDTFDSTITEIDQAIEQAEGFTTTGIPGAITGWIPGSPAFDLDRTILTIKANIGFDRLQRMRELSPTGGALGSVANQELEALQATIASLDPNQGEDQLIRNLKKVKGHYEKWREAVAKDKGIKLTDESDDIDTFLDDLFK